MFPQVHALIAGFDRYLDAFDRLCPFSEEKITCHRATIALVRKATSPTDLLDDDAWFRALHYTLEKWGMDARGARLLDVGTIRASFRGLRAEIVEIEGLRLESIDHYYRILTERKVWGILDRLTVGEQEVNLVANSKALHHLLPDLVPPMDRKYTIVFFFGNQARLSADTEKRLFERMWPAFHKIAVEALPAIQRRLGPGMYTSVPKVIDNAIVGYVKTEIEGRR